MIWFALLVALAVVLLIKSASKSVPIAQSSNPYSTSVYPRLNEYVYVSGDAQRFAQTAFGSDWKALLEREKLGSLVPPGFATEIGKAYDQLTVAEKKDLNASFLRAKTATDRDTTPKAGFTLTVGFEHDYAALHDRIAELLLTGELSSARVLTCLRHILQDRLTAQAARAEDGIIDVSGPDIPLPLLTSLSPAQQVSLPSAPVYTPSESSYYSEDYKLGTKYKQKLGLTPQEVGWLNKFWNPATVFLSIEGCCTATIQFYLLLLRELNKEFKKAQSTLTKEVVAFSERQTAELPSQSLAFSSSYADTYYASWQTNNKDSLVADVYLAIFKRAENAVREAYQHKRKLSDTFTYAYAAEAFETTFGQAINVLIEKKRAEITVPDFPTLLEINAQNTTRWKLSFEAIARQLSLQTVTECVEKLYRLGEENARNPSVENIYYEASKLLAPIDRAEAVKFYLHYLHQDLKSDHIDNKQLGKTVQKALFKSAAELEDFGRIVEDLVRTRNLAAAVAQVPSMYGPKRKKIILDRQEIDQVKQQHSGTVQLLSEVLQEDEGGGLSSTPQVSTHSINEAELLLQIGIPAERSAPPSPLNDTQLGLLTLFLSNGNTLPETETEAYALSRGLFKNQLIDGINEACYDLLDDVLIEEGDQAYELNAHLYQKLTAHAG